MYFSSIYFLTLLLSLSLAVHHVESLDELSDSIVVLHEEFSGFDDASVVDKDHQYFLRRGLQTGGVCRPNNPLNVPLPQADVNFCNELPNYPCQCNGSAETSCTYCMIRVDATARGIRCQVSGSSVTFVDGTGTVTTCGCEYLGNGQVQQHCYQESGPVPIPAPAVVIAPPPAPIAVRAPIATTVAVPAVPAPGSTASGSGGGGKGSSKSRKLKVKESQIE